MKSYIVAWTVRVPKDETTLLNLQDGEEPWEYIERYIPFKADEWKNPQHSATQYYNGIRFPETGQAPDAVREGEILWHSCVSEMIDETSLI